RDEKKLVKEQNIKSFCIDDGKLFLLLADGSSFNLTKAIQETRQECEREKETAFRYYERNKRHLWSKIHKQKKLRESLRKRILTDLKKKVEKKKFAFAICSSKPPEYYLKYDDILQLIEEMKR
nr:hypothetical protein [Candidatus Aenigmarchaeota archaeon]